MLESEEEVPPVITEQRRERLGVAGTLVLGRDQETCTLTYRKALGMSPHVSEPQFPHEQKEGVGSDVI